MRRLRRRHLTAILLSAVALIGLLLTSRTPQTSPPEQMRLSPDYFFQDAEVTLIGEDGRAALEIIAAAARKRQESSALLLDKVFLRRGDPQSLSLQADSAQIPEDESGIFARGNIRIVVGPGGKWAAQARQAEVQENGARVILTGDMSFARADGSGPSISGEHLTLDLDRMMAQTDQRVLVRLGDAIFQTDGLSAQINEGTFTLDSNVRAIIQP